MLIGNKDVIAYDFIGVNNSMGIVDIYIGNHHLTYEDNSHYYPMIVNGIKKEIEYFQDTDLSLKDEYKEYAIDELFEHIHNQETQIHEQVEMCSDFFTYDLSTKRASFYVYQQEANLVFFGNLYDSNDIITVTIPKDDYVALLSKLLALLIS